MKKILNNISLHCHAWGSRKTISMTLTNDFNKIFLPCIRIKSITLLIKASELLSVNVHHNMYFCKMKIISCKEDRTKRYLQEIGFIFSNNLFHFFYQKKLSHCSSEIINIHSDFDMDNVLTIYSIIKTNTHFKVQYLYYVLIYNYTII